MAAANGQDPRLIGADHKALQQLGVFVELHVEQGRGLADLEPARGHRLLHPGPRPLEAALTAKATTPEPR